ncbi:MAG: hypothetical protein WEC34_00200 [Acidimicrobiia bacterium]
MEYTDVLDFLLEDRQLAALRGSALPVQGTDTEIVEIVCFQAYMQRTSLWELTPGTRFKKNSRDWSVGVISTCVGFCLGASLFRGVEIDSVNREYLAKALDFAQLGAAGLLDEREDFASLGARGARVLEAALNRARIKVKKPFDLLRDIGLSWVVATEQLRELQQGPSPIARGSASQEAFDRVIGPEPQT